jgi:hypothetical protein
LKHSTSITFKYFAFMMHECLCTTGSIREYATLTNFLAKGG